MLNIKHTNYGFSMIELMITIAMLAMVLGIGMPAFGQMISNMRVRALANGVLGAIQVARSEAIRSNANVTWRIDNQQGGKWTVVLPDGTTKESSSADSPAEIAVSSGDTSMVFNNIGQRTTPAANMGTVWVDVTNAAFGTCQSSGGSVRCLRITVSSGGIARLCDPFVAEDDPRSCRT